MAGDAPRLKDPILTAVMANRFEAIGREMTNVLQRAARSSVINQAKDLTCSILTADNRLVTAADGLPQFLVGTEDLTRSMTDLIDDLAPGDAFLHNDPFLGNTHHADFTIVVPVFWEGEHVFTVACKAHQADCGNVEATTYMANARDVFEEGALNFPCVRVQRDHRDVEDVVRMIRSRLRLPDVWYGDHLAMVGAARTGERRLTEVLEKYGRPRLEAFIEEWFGYSEHLMIQEIRKFPSGRFEAEAMHDPIPGVTDEIPVRIAVTIDAEDGFVDFDLTDNIDCIPAGLNLSESTAKNSPIMGMLNGIPARLPINSGSLRRLRVHLRHNCVVGIPAHPTCCSMATNHIADRVSSMTQRALAGAVDGLGLADGGMGMGPGVGVVSGGGGAEPRYQTQVILGWSGGPGSPWADGWMMNFLNQPCAGVVEKDSIEMDELVFPMIVWEQRLREDGEGAGRRRGAPGTKAVFGPRRGEMAVHYVIDGQENPPLGVRGGGNGAPGRAFKIHADGTRVELPLVDGTRLAVGERIESLGCGGGGYGPAWERDTGAVLADVRDGLVSRARALEVYGVALADGGGRWAVDEPRTAARRRELAAPERATR